jgi:hypothetical protein
MTYTWKVSEWLDHYSIRNLAVVELLLGCWDAISRRAYQTTVRVEQSVVDICLIVNLRLLLLLLSHWLLRRDLVHRSWYRGWLACLGEGLLNRLNTLIDQLLRNTYLCVLCTSEWVLLLSSPKWVLSALVLREGISCWFWLRLLILQLGVIVLVHFCDNIN